MSLQDFYAKIAKGEFTSPFTEDGVLSAIKALQQSADDQLSQMETISLECELAAALNRLAAVLVKILKRIDSKEKETVKE